MPQHTSPRFKFLPTVHGGSLCDHLVRSSTAASPRTGRRAASIRALASLVCCLGLSAVGACDAESSPDAQGPGAGGKADEDGPVSDAELIATENRNLRLFSAYDTWDDSSKGNTCVEPRESTGRRFAGGQQSVDYMRVISSRAELSEELDLDAKVTAVVGGAETSAKASLLDKFERKTNSLYFLYKARSSYIVNAERTSTDKDDMVLNATGRTQAAAGSSEFVRTCGSTYVNSLERSGSLFVLIELQAKTSEASNTIATEFGAEISAVDVGASGSAKIATASKEEGVNLSVDIVKAGFEPTAESQQFLTDLAQGKYSESTYEGLRSMASELEQSVEKDRNCESENCTADTIITGVTLGDYTTIVDLFTEGADGSPGLDRDEWNDLTKTISDNGKYLKRMAEQIERMNRVSRDEIRAFLEAPAQLQGGYNVWNTATVYDIERGREPLLDVLEDAGLLDEDFPLLDDQREIVPSSIDQLKAVASFWEALFAGDDGNRPVGVAWNMVADEFGDCRREARQNPAYVCGNGELGDRLAGDSVFPEIDELLHFHYHQFGRILPVKYWAYEKAIDGYRAVEKVCGEYTFPGGAPGRLPTREEAERLALLVSAGPISWEDDDWFGDWAGSDPERYAIYYRGSDADCASGESMVMAHPPGAAEVVFRCIDDDLEVVPICVPNGAGPVPEPETP